MLYCSTYCINCDLDVSIPVTLGLCYVAAVYINCDLDISIPVTLGLCYITAQTV